MSNNSLSSVTGLTLNKLYYRFRVLDTISILLASDLPISTEAFNKLKFNKREEADNALIFVSIAIKVRYDIKYLAINLEKGDKVFFRLYYRYSIPRVTSKKLS